MKRFALTLVLALVAVCCFGADAYRIKTDDVDGRHSCGTAFVYRGYVVTAAHVVEDGKTYWVEVGDKWRPATLEHADRYADVALLKVAEKLPELKRGAVAESDRVTVPASVAAQPVKDLDGVYVRRRYARGSYCALLVVPGFADGGSGAPVLKGGRLVGILTARLVILGEELGASMVPVSEIDATIKDARK